MQHCQTCGAITEELHPCPCELGNQCPVIRGGRRRRAGTPNVGGICPPCYATIRANALDRRIERNLSRAVA